jgi:hypothetical protein
MYRKLMGVLLLLALCFPVAMAVDFSGPINAIGPTSYFTGAGGAPNVAVPGNNVSVNWWTNFDTTGTPNYYIMYDITDNYLVGSTTFELNDTLGVYASGTFQALNGTFAPSTRKQYYLLTFTNWNPGTRSGVVNGKLTLPAAGVINMGIGPSLTAGAFGGGAVHWSAGIGNLTMGGGNSGSSLRVLMGGAEEYGEPGTAIATYNVTKTSGWGDATLARIYVTKNTDNTLASNIRVLSSPGGYTVFYTSPWTDKDGMESIDVVGNSYYIQSYVAGLSTKYWNSSLIVFDEAPETPTPTPTPTGGTLPAGYTRTTVYATDGGTGGTIVGATLSLKDVENGTWRNSTSSLSGSIIDVLNGHTLDIYGSYSGVYTSSQELGVTPGGNYYLPLMPPISVQPVGYVNVIINVQDSDTHLIVPSASVSFRLPTGATTVESTGSWGTAQTVQPNNTVLIVGVSKSGYQSISISFNTGTGADVVRTLQLTKAIVATPTPVVTDPGTGAIITPVPTVMPGCDIDPLSEGCIKSKDSNLMAKIRDNAPTILDLAIYAIILGLLGMILSGIMKWGK